MCLFTCRDKVVPTDCLCSSQALQEAVLPFSVQVKFEQLSNNFEVKMEVYCLSLPKHKVKGNEKKFSSYGFSSKLKTKHSVSSNFKLIGHYTFNLANCREKRYLLNEFDSPYLEQSILMEINLGAAYKVNYKCYLSFKEKYGEFPVWNRKWCVLDGYLLHFWRYYEDEDSKSPLGVINIKECVNLKIVKASSNISMRENCFAFLTVSKRAPNSPCFYLLAADLQSEMEEWLEKLNFVLKYVRIWEHDASAPWDELRLKKWMK